MSTSLSIILIIIALLLGVGTGALLHKLLGRGSNYYRQMLAERDREIEQMRSHMHQHLSQVTDMAEQLNTQSVQLNQMLARETQLLDSDVELKRRVRILNGQTAMTDEEEQAEALSLHVPRDYADESPNAFVNAPKAHDGDNPQPPRY